MPTACGSAHRSPISRCVSCPPASALRGKGTASVSVYAIRKDGFTGEIKLGLKDPPEGFSSAPISLSATQEVAKLTVKTTLMETKQPVNLIVEGRAKIQDQDIAHEAVPAEDKMQAFLWRHLVPAEELKVLVYDPSYHLRPNASLRRPRSKCPPRYHRPPRRRSLPSSPNRRSAGGCDSSRSCTKTGC